MAPNKSSQQLEAVGEYYDPESVRKEKEVRLPL